MNAYAPPVDLNTFYDDETLDHLHRVIAGREWAIHLIGPDEIHFNEDFEKPEDDPTNPELTQRTALKVATEVNALAAELARPGEDPSIMYHAVVFHQGEPWVPSELDGPVDEYCEWFDFDTCEWFCNQCFTLLVETHHCPTCAPTQFPGLMRVLCDNDPQHPAIFMYADNTGDYGAYCFFCIGEHRNQVESERRHAGHKAWRTWRSTRRLLNGLCRLGVCRGWCYSLCHSGQSCISGIRWRWSR